MNRVNLFSAYAFADMLGSHLHISHGIYNQFVKHVGAHFPLQRNFGKTPMKPHFVKGA